MLMLLSFIVFSAIVYFKLIIPQLYWKKRGIFYIRPWTRFSQVFLNKQPFAELIKQQYNNYPQYRYYGSYQFLQPSLFVRDLDLIKQITVKDFEHFTDHLGLISEKTDPVLGLNLFSLKGQKWRAMRSTLSPTFTSSKMKLMFKLIEETAQSFVGHFMDKGHIIELNMKDAYSKYTNDVIANCAFGIKLDSVANPTNDFFKRGQIFMSTSIWVLIRSLLYGFFPKVFEFFRIAVISPEICQFFERLVKDTIAIREQNNIVRPDMINLLMEARRGHLKTQDETQTPTSFAEVEETYTSKNSIEITDNIITAQALVFFIAGFTTSSSLLSFLSYELAIQPQLQNRLHAEISENQDETGQVSYEKLLKMKYLDQVVSEGLRKWPPGYVLNRVCVKDYLIKPKSGDEKPALISEGCLVAVPVIAIHYCKEFFPNPDLFDPERFSDENKAKIIPGSYMPFGAGPRNCIGSRFALLEIKTLLVCLLSKFEVVPVVKTKIPMELAKTLSLEAKGGIWLGLKQRL